MRIEMANADQQPSARAAGAEGVREPRGEAATQVPGYSPAEAAHALQLCLEGGLSLEGFEDWLKGYPYAPNGPLPDDIEDELNRAVLAVSGYRSGTRDAEALRKELMDVRSHLSGY